MPLALGLNGGASGFSVRDDVVLLSGDVRLNDCEELGTSVFVQSFSACETGVDDNSQLGPLSRPKIYQKVLTE
jgi:hypothetical protein